MDLLPQKIRRHFSHQEEFLHNQPAHQENQDGNSLGCNLGEEINQLWKWRVNLLKKSYKLLEVLWKNSKKPYQNKTLTNLIFSQYKIHSLHLRHIKVPKIFHLTGIRTSSFRIIRNWDKFIWVVNLHCHK